MRVHSARYTQCIHVSSRKLKLPKDTRTKRYKQLLPTHPFPKVELYIAVKCKNIYRVTNNDNNNNNNNKKRCPEQYQKFTFLEPLCPNESLRVLLFAYVCMLTAFETLSLLWTLVNKECESKCSFILHVQAFAPELCWFLPNVVLWAAQEEIGRTVSQFWQLFCVTHGYQSKMIASYHTLLS